MAGDLSVGSQYVVAGTSADFFALGASASGGAGQWIRHFTLRAKASSGRGYLNSIAGDPNHPAFVICGATDSAATDLVPSPANQGGVDAIVASLDSSDGHTIWSQRIGGVNDEYCNFVAIDGLSNIYVVGTYTYGSSVSFVNLAPLPIVDQAGGTTWLFVAKLDSAGNGLWAKAIGTGQANSFQATAVWPVGDGLVLAGRVPAQGSISGVALSPTSPMFVAKLAANDGQIAWAVAPTTTQGGASDAITQLSSNSRGGIILAGKYVNSLTFGATTLPDANVAGVFIAQVAAATGQPLIARGYGGPTERDSVVGIVTNVNALGSDKDASLFLGQFTGQIDLGAPLGVLTGSSTAIVQSTFAARLVP
jgi:hypothetical protein